MTIKSIHDQKNGFRKILITISLLLLSQVACSQLKIGGILYQIVPLDSEMPEISLVDINATYETIPEFNQVVISLKPTIKSENVAMKDCSVSLRNPGRHDITYYSHEPIQYSEITSSGNQPNRNEFISMICFLPQADKTAHFELVVAGKDANGWQRDITIRFTLPINQPPAGMSLTGRDNLMFLSSPGHAEVAIFENNNFYHTILSHANSGTELVYKTNWNNDGREDYLFSDGPNLIFAYWKTNLNGSLYLKSKQIRNIGWLIGLIGKGDFNGDGITDLLYYDHFSSEVVQWFVNIDDEKLNSRNRQNRWARQPNLKIIGISDFDGDGKSDILWHDTQTDELVVWDEEFNETRHGYYDSDTFKFLCFIDTNLNQKMDLIYIIEETGSLYTKRLNPNNATIETIHLGKPEYDPGSGLDSFVGTGNFIGENVQEMVFQFSTRNNDSYCTIFELHNDQIIPIGISSLQPISTQQDPIQIGDYDGDGLSEIFSWHNMSEERIEPTVYNINKDNMWYLDKKVISSNQLLQKHHSWDSVW